MAEVRTRDGVWTFDEEVVRIVPGHDRKVHKLRRALGERVVPVRAIAGVALEEGRRGGRLRLRLRQGADPFLHVAAGGLGDDADPDALRVDRASKGAAEWFVDELRHALGEEAARPTDRFLLPAPPTPLSATAGDGTVSFDGTRVRIEWTEWAGSHKEGAAPTEIALADLRGVEWTPIAGLTNGHLRFLVAGATAGPPDRDLHCITWGVLREGGTTSLLAAAVVARLPHAGAGTAPTAADALTAGGAAPGDPTVPATTDPGRAAQQARTDGTGDAGDRDDHDVVLRRLRELGELRDAEVLTAEEFTVAKQALLRRL